MTLRREMPMMRKDFLGVAALGGFVFLGFMPELSGG